MPDAKDNIAVLDSFYAAFNAGDMDGAFAYLSPDIEWIYHGPKDRIGFAGTFQGHDGVREFFSQVGEAIEVVEMKPEKFQAIGDEVFGVGIEHSRSLRTGKEYRVRWAHLYQVEDGLVTRFEEFLDTAAVAEALT